MKRFRAVVPVLVLLVAVTTACGVPPSDGAAPIAPDVANLLERGAPGETDGTAGQVDAVVAWVRDDRLVTTIRQVAAETRQEQLDAALAALLAGPGPEEQQIGLTTLLPPDLVVDGVVEGARVVLDLTAASTLEPGRVPLAVGQTALTALGVPGVRGVTFAVDGEATRVPVPGGGTTRVVRATDYRDVTE